MSVRVVTHSSMLAGRFNEDAPRPPVPGEEDDTAIDAGSGRTNYTRSCLPYGASLATPRRSDLDLGYEPEGSASPAPAHLRWAESLHSLLDDQDGIALFRSFLQQEGCPDLLDFWFACSGFRKLPATSGADGHQLKLAKVIYRKYVSDSAGSSAVARRIKVGTKNFIRESVSRGRLDSALFEQAQAEVQALMEDNVYPLFLKSDTYLAHARATGGESASPPNRNSAGSPESQPAQTTLPYLPTLEEDAEWAQSEAGRDNSAALTRRLLMETAQRRCRTGVSWTGAEQTEARFGMRELINPYYVNSGFARAPVASANDSELQSLSSDADTISLTDSSVDGIPPYRYRKQQRRNMQQSVRANGHVPLPHIPRTHRLPKDIHVEPQKFAAELISRLEVVQRERDNHRQLEERLHRVRMEEECDDADVSTATCPSVPKPGATHSARQWRDSHVENPESILDEHVQRVMKTPGCQSPRAASGSKHSEPPGYGWGADAHYATRGRYYSEAAVPTACHSDANGSKVNSLSRRSGRLKSEEGRGASGRGLEVSEEAELKQRHLQWTGEGERESTRYRKSWACARSGWVSEHHDAGGSAAQQEEARRRSVAQHCKPQRPKPSSSSSSVGNGNGNTNGSRRSVSESMTVAYYFCGEPIPYRTSVKGRVLTLRQFKELLTRKGAYRFYFKKVSDEFDCGVVYEEVREDDAVLPIYQERIVGKVEKIH